LNLDETMMRRALELAALGAGQVSPSPLVGCVIAADDGRVVGEGYYVNRAVKHAETIALEQAGRLARGGTAYVSLEPHAHQGRTPPCTDALIRAGIKRVVAPIQDPNPDVSGRGFEHLREAGIEVSVGLLADEAARLNEKYIHFKAHSTPFVHLKIATSLDGRIATRTGDSRWITGEASRERVQELRHENDAILIGAGTAEVDDPLLTDRSGKPRHSPFVRVVLDSGLRLSPASKLAQTAREVPVIVFAAESADPSKEEALTAVGIEVIRTSTGPRNLQLVLDELGRRLMLSVLVEGGASVAGAFIDARLVDKFSFFIAPMIIGGTDAPIAVAGRGAELLKDATSLRDVEVRHHGGDVEITGYPGKRNGVGGRGRGTGARGRGRPL
jgi:diaminohydroxyphosphoribosylaminopyrimidine deaminase/5-amino-6-(5-phosphoribosylamino)uracil reductase